MTPLAAVPLAVASALSVIQTAGAQPVATRAAVVATPRPPTDSVRPARNPHYTGTRAPLAAPGLIKLPIGSITPRSWLRTQLVLMRQGMTGHLDEISPWCDADTSAWITADGLGKNGWEELPYWLRGAGDLAYVLDDKDLSQRTRRWIDGVLANQDASGYFGPRENKDKLDLWPNMLVLNALQSFHEATGDPRVLPFMSRYFQWQLTIPKETLLPGSWQKIRGGDNLESILWLYNRTGEAWLLDLARTIHERTSRWDKGVADLHGVNFCQGFREPAVFSLLSRDEAHLAQAEKNYQDIMARFGQVPGGMFGADEVAREGYGDPRQAAETCSMAEFMHSFEMLLGITGDVTWADRCEEVAFNSLPAAFTADYRALHYLTAPNMPQADTANHSPGFFNGGNMLGFDPADHRCCQHNHAFGWPYFAEHLWMATPDGGLAATLYSACDVRAKVADGAEVIIHENTEYPFDESITLTIDLPPGRQSVRFPVYLRVPRWCDTPSLLLSGRPMQMTDDLPVAGAWLRISRAWANGDTVSLALPMRTAVTTWTANQGSVSVSHGPLWYSLKIGERANRYGGTEAWAAYELLPATPWNYGVILNPADPPASFVFSGRAGALPDQPFAADASPVRLTAVGRRIPNWGFDYTGLCAPLQQSPVRSTEPDESITLIPMGAARLRISAFPVIGNGPDAREWALPPKPRHEASFYNDDILAPSDGRLPSSSDDHAIPRFTWWNRKGTSEWITWSFDEPREISSTAVYWFDDTGRGQCRVPASWKLLYRAGDQWHEVEPEAGTAYRVEPDRLNRVVFKPVSTTELRLDVHLQDHFSGGILEWQINDGR